MKVFLLIGVFLVLVIQTEAFSCFHIVCSETGTSCSELQAYFTCLKSEGCTEKDSVYNDAISKLNSKKCNRRTSTCSPLSCTQTGTSCSALQNYVTCLKKNGCTEDSLFYKSAISDLETCSGGTSTCSPLSCTQTGTSCSALQKYLTCLKSNGCTEDDSFYKSAIFQINFYRCSGGTSTCTPFSCTQTGTSCSALLTYFTCLKNNGCAEDDSFYKSAISQINFYRCSGVSLTVSSVLAITMMVAARFFSE